MYESFDRPLNFIRISEYSVEEVIVIWHDNITKSKAIGRLVNEIFIRCSDR